MGTVERIPSLGIASMAGLAVVRDDAGNLLRDDYGRALLVRADALIPELQASLREANALLTDADRAVAEDPRS